MDHRDPGRQLTHALVRICAPGEADAAGAVHGMGFFVDDRHVLTCAHVVRKALGLTDDTPPPPDATVHVDFPLRHGTSTFSARVVPETWRASGLDVALLRVEPSPDASPSDTTPDVQVPDLSTANVYQHAFSAFGCPDGHDDGVWAEGAVAPGGESSVQLHIDDRYLVQGGFSGTPVWDRDERAVVGIVAEYDANPSPRAAFMLPLTTLADALPRVDDAVTRRETRPMAVYRNALRRTVDAVRIFPPDETHRLRDVFFDLTVEKTDHQTNQKRQRPPDVIPDHPAGAFAEEAGRVRVDPETLLEPGTRAVVVGVPGCGKSTLLKYLALQTLDDAERFPVFVELKSLDTDDFPVPSRFDPQRAGTLYDLAFKHGVVRRADVDDVEPLRRHFDEHRTAGTLALYLDGLDEVRGETFFGDLRKLILKATSGAPDDQPSIIVSSRPFALESPLSGFTQAEIQTLTDAQIEAFVAGYYPDDAATRDFLATVKKRDLGDVVRVPLLLSMAVHYFRRDWSPDEETRVLDVLDLYDRAVDHLLVDLDGTKGARRLEVDDPGGRHKRAAFESLAFDGFFRPSEREGERIVFDHDDLRDLANRFAPDGADPNAFFQDLKNMSLLHPHGRTSYTFAHLTLQEYLAAVHLAARDDAADRIARAVFDPVHANREVLPMALAMLRDPDVYAQLDALPESFYYDRFLITVRSEFYLADPPDAIVTPLQNQLQSMWDHGNTVGDRILSEAVKQTYQRTTSTLIRALVPLLFETVRAPEGYWKDQAIDTLGEIGSEAAVEALARLVQDREAGGEERGRAAWVLGRIGSEARTDVLARLVQDTGAEDEARLRTAKTLGLIGSEAGVGALVNVVQDREADEWVRRRAAAGLGLIRSEAGVGALARLVEDRDADDNLRCVAAMALGKIGSEAGVAALARLVEARDADDALRREAAWALGRIGSDAGVEELSRVVQDYEADRWTRRVAASALGSIAHAAGVPALVYGLGERHIHRSAADALANVPRVVLADGLRRTLDDERVSVSVWRRIVGLFLTLDDDGVSASARRRAVEHVGFYFEDDALLRKLEAMATDDPDASVREAASEAAARYARKLDLFDRTAP